MQNRLLGIILVLSLNFAGLLALPSSATALAGSRPTESVDWPQFAFDQSNSNFNPYETILDPGNAKDLGPVWNSPLGESHTSSPAVVGTTLYVCGSSHVYALDAASGATIWSAPPGCAYLAVADGIVVANQSFSSQLVALDAVTGSQLWSVNVGGGGTAAPPTIADGVVYVGSTDGTLFAVDESSGLVQWTRLTQGPIFDATAVGEGRAYVESDDGGLYAFDVATGASAWRKGIGGGSIDSPVFADGVVFASSWNEGTINAFDAATGRKLWSVVPGCTPNQPSLANGVLFVPTSCQTVAMDAATGQFLWHASFSTLLDVPSTIAVANGVLYLANDRYLLVANAETGHKLASFQLGLPASPPSSPIVVNGRVYSATTYSRGGVFALGI